MALTPVVENVKMTADTLGMLAGNNAAADRWVQRGSTLLSTLKHPIDTVSTSHADAIAQIEAHEGAGDQFSAGMVAGELGANDAVTVVGGVEGGAAVARMVRAGVPKVVSTLGTLAEESGVKTPSSRWEPGRSIVMKTTKGTPPVFSTVQRRFWKNQGLTSAPSRINPVSGKVESMELSHRFVPQRLTLFPPNVRNAPFNLEPLWPQEHAAVDWYRWRTLDPTLKPTVPEPSKPLF